MLPSQSLPTTVRSLPGKITEEIIIEKEAQTGESGDKIADSAINEDLHRTIARISKNRYLQQYSQHIVWRSSFYIFFFGNDYVQDNFKKYMLSPPQHEMIVKAIANKNAEKADNLMKQHVRFTIEVCHIDRLALNPSQSMGNTESRPACR